MKTSPDFRGWLRTQATRQDRVGAFAQELSDTNTTPKQNSFKKHLDHLQGLHKHDLVNSLDPKRDADLAEAWLLWKLENRKWGEALRDIGTHCQYVMELLLQPDRDRDKARTDLYKGMWFEIILGDNQSAVIPDLAFNYDKKSRLHAFAFCAPDTLVQEGDRVIVQGREASINQRVEVPGQNFPTFRAELDRTSYHEILEYLQYTAVSYPYIDPENGPKDWHLCVFQLDRKLLEWGIFDNPAEVTDRGPLVGRWAFVTRQDAEAALDLFTSGGRLFIHECLEDHSLLYLELVKGGYEPYLTILEDFYLRKPVGTKGNY